MGPSRDQDWGASGSKHVIRAVFAPRKVLCKSSCWEWPHTAHPRESGCGQALGLTPAACPAFSPPIPSFHQMLGLEDETALPTPVPAASLCSSRSGAWMQPCRLNKAEPLSGSPRRAALIWSSRLAKSRQAMAAAPGCWGPSPPPAPKLPWPLLPPAKRCQHLSSIPASSPKPGDPPLTAHCCTPNHPLGTASQCHPLCSPSLHLSGGWQIPWGLWPRQGW